MRLIIFLFLVFFCFSACSVKQDALRVAGLYDKGTQLDVYLVARDGVNKDTLSKGEVLDGFSFSKNGFETSCFCGDMSKKNRT